MPKGTVWIGPDKDHQQVDWERVARSLAGRLGDIAEVRQPGLAWSAGEDLIQFSSLGWPFK